MALIEVKLSIDKSNIDRYLDACEGLYQIPMIDDPNNPGTLIKQFTRQQWGKEVLRRFAIHQVARWEQVKAQRAIPFSPDDTLVT